MISLLLASSKRDTQRENQSVMAKPAAAGLAIDCLVAAHAQVIMTAACGGFGVASMSVRGGNVNVVLQRGSRQCVLLQQSCDDVEGLGAAAVKALAGLPQEASSAEADAEAAERTKLVGLALAYLKADCYGDFSVHAALTAEASSMFGAQGRDNIVALKRTYLDPGAVNYDVDEVLAVDPGSRVVVASFECYIPGRTGRGTDVVQFNDAYKATGANSIRHEAVGF